MRFVYGLVGAVIGIIVGGAGTILLLSAIFQSDTLGFAFAVIYLGCIGLVVGVIAGILVSQLLWHRSRHEPADGQIRSHSGIVLIGWVAVPLLASWGMLWGSSLFGQPPSDSVLLENFARHRPEFDQLAWMVEKDQGLRRVDYNWTDPSDPKKAGVSDKRIAKYRQLLAKVGVPRGFETTDGQTEVDFLYWLTGSAISSDTDKGYAYLTKPPAVTRDSLDGYRRDDDKPSEAYRHITGNWYLFYEYEPG